MENRKLTPDGLYEKTSSQRRDIAYTPDFKNWVTEHKGAMMTVISLISEIEQETFPIKNELENWYEFDDPSAEEIELYRPKLIGKVFKKDNVEISLEIYKSSQIYKVKIGQEIFFIKVEDGDRLDTGGKMGGYGEINASAKAKKILEDLKNVEVVDFKLGYTDKKRGKKYFVTKWEVGVVSMSDYMFSLDKKSRKFKILSEQIKKIQNILRNNHFIDVDTHNFFYNQSKNKIIIFDLNLN